MKNIFTLLLITFTAVANAQSGALQGTVTETETAEPLMFATVVVKQKGVLKTGTQTDFDGKYRFDSLAVGTYDVEVSYVGYPTKMISGVVLFPNKNLTLNIEMLQGVEFDYPIILPYKIPLIDIYFPTQGTIFTADEIKRTPHKN
ncbi:MAG: carboxypeptidase-like regulatory domain-containing protein [Saprospiraceae bacterium]|nr:carboxypeptidase-like regulatory domain-containing protein [Saprospiraceae bacterium]